MWQPSLVLGKLGGALRVSMACESPILASWHSMPTKAKIIAHSLEVSKKKVTSVSDSRIMYCKFYNSSAGYSIGNTQNNIFQKMCVNLQYTAIHK